MRHGFIVCCVLLLASAAACADDSYLPAGKDFTWTYDLTMNTQVGGISVPVKGSATCVCSGPEKIGDFEFWVYSWAEERRNHPKTEVKVWARCSPELVAVLKATGEDFHILPMELKKTEKKEVKVLLGDGDAVVASTVVGEEEIETPAGKFKCVKVTAETSMRAIKASTTTWYAKGVGVVKSVHASDVAGSVKAERELVLKKFDKGEKGDKKEPGDKEGDGK